MPVLGRLLDEVVDGVADLGRLADEGVGEVVGGRVRLRVVAELLRGDRLAEVEGERVHDVLFGRRERRELWHLGAGAHGAVCARSFV